MDYPDGSVYDGYWRNGYKFGEGIITLPGNFRWTSSKEKRLKGYFNQIFLDNDNQDSWYFLGKGKNDKKEENTVLYRL